MKRILVGGIVGGLVLFFWGAFSHMVLPLGEVGIETIPNEAPLIQAMREALPGSGLYLFPGYDLSRKLSEAELQTWQEKYKVGPTGFLVYRAKGSEPMGMSKFITELSSNILAALVAAFLLARSRASFAGRILFVTLLGLFAWLSISVSYWNWYGFPLDFITAEGIQQIGGWLITGLALAAIVKGD